MAQLLTHHSSCSGNAEPQPVARRRPGHWYLALCLVFMAGMVVQTLGQRWSGDYWAHRSAVLELSQDPWSPDHPFTGSEAADPGLSPYTLGLGLLARMIPFGVADVLSVAALLNTALFLVGLRRFVGRFSTAPMAPFWTLLATLFLWGRGPWRWSGYLSANSIGFGLPFPSMFATALLLFGLSALIDFCDRGDRRHLVGLIVLAPVAILTHPFTGAAMGVGALAIVVSRLGTIPARRLWELTGAAAAAAAAVVAWPLYSVIDLLAASSGYDGVHFLLYRLVGQRTVLALLAIPVLAVRFRAHHRDPLVLIASGATGIFAVGGLSGSYSLGRILPLGMLAAHVAVGVWMAERAPILWRRRGNARRLTSAVGGAMVFVYGVFGCQAGLARAVPRALLPASVANDPRLDPGDAGLSFLGRETTPDDVALVPGLEAARITPAFGAKVVWPGYVAPLVDDTDRRRADVAHFYRTNSAEERRAVIRRYDVSFVLFDLRRGAADLSLGTVAHRDRSYVLVAVSE